MKIAIGCDHAGYDLKSQIIPALKQSGHQVEDLGAYDVHSSDYPDFAIAVAEAVSSGVAERGIFICGTGVGPAMVANRIPGVRAVACYDTFCARNSRDHNDANLLTLGARVVGPGYALDIVGVWLSTPFSGEERHQRRIDKMMALDR